MQRTLYNAPNVRLLLLQLPKETQRSEEPIRCTLLHLTKISIWSLRFFLLVPAFVIFARESIRRCASWSTQNCSFSRPQLITLRVSSTASIGAAKGGQRGKIICCYKPSSFFFKMSGGSLLCLCPVVRWFSFRCSSL